MEEPKKIQEFRDTINSIQTMDELVENVLSCCGHKIHKGKIFNYINLSNFNYICGDITIAWTYNSYEGLRYGLMYILHGIELVKSYYFESEVHDIPQSIIEYILDDVFKLNTSEAFYRFYFGKFGYMSIADDVKSELVKEILDHFTTNGITMLNIFINDKYTSITISGRKRNGTDYEYNHMGCTKDDIIELIEVTRIKPHINRKSDFYYHSRPINPYFGVSTSKIMDSYNEYKDSCMYD